MIKLFLICVAIALFIISQWLVNEMEGDCVGTFCSFLSVLALVIFVIAFLP